MGETPAVVYPASGVGSSLARADMGSAPLHRHTLQAAGKLPAQLSVLCGVGATRLDMMVDQTRRRWASKFNQAGWPSASRLSQTLDVGTHSTAATLLERLPQAFGRVILTG